MFWAPAVKNVTTTSSKESANASSPPATSADETTGQIKTRNVSQTAAPRPGFNDLGERNLPMLNGTTWSAATATRSIAWALADVLRNED